MEFKNTKYLKNAEVELRLREAVQSVEKFGVCSCAGRRNRKI